MEKQEESLLEDCTAEREAVNEEEELRDGN